ncbi:Permease of the drug/metabolite transporter (DMT) superfamily [Dethiosulfatibacter aminovorans DSM 17477]|uniref:Permease of the drug/metabolite transporter (DMT) superfamily n=1 Tax=Dethiosulfatibacter aminovorans DSM 17477 TaxID=1121476 RepID=A0A1M6M3S8_9FIRM|nr:DMT family transporter [Dethiosulfatibacter aminovorans]SHJ78119.1 Permease of the drug/metabolite transporter (DMT) superfamily [Dethiosulfatibacter aminovorans DSM 17477]
MKRDKIIALIAAIGASCIWGMSYVSKEVLMEVFHPGTLMSIQFGLATLLLGSYNFFFRKTFSIKGRDFMVLLCTGLLGITLFNLLANTAIKVMNSSIVTVLFALIPVVCLFTDRMIFKKKFTRLKLVCVIGSIIGVVFIIGAGSISIDTNSMTGYLYTFISMLTWVAYCYISEKYYDKYEMIEILIVQGLGGVLTSFFYVFMHPVDMAGITPAIAGHMAVIVILNACISYFLYIIAIKGLGVTVTNVFNNLVPVVTLCINIAFYGYVVDRKGLIGTAIIIASVIALNIFDGREKSVPYDDNLEKIV